MKKTILALAVILASCQKLPVQVAATFGIGLPSGEMTKSETPETLCGDIGDIIANSQPTNSLVFIRLENALSSFSGTLGSEFVVDAGNYTASARTGHNKLGAYGNLEFYSKYTFYGTSQVAVTPLKKEYTLPANFTCALLVFETATIDGIVCDDWSVPLETYKGYSYTFVTVAENTETTIVVKGKANSAYPDKELVINSQTVHGRWYYYSMKTPDDFLVSADISLPEWERGLIKEI